MGKSRREALQRGFIYYALSTCLLAAIFFFYIVAGSQTGYMDAGGWAFFTASCLSHAAQVLLIPFLLFYIPFACLRLQRLAAVLFVAGVAVLCAGAYLNLQVYALYRFHINGFILTMLFGQGADTVFTFAPMLVLKQALLLLLLILVCAAGWYAAGWLWCRRRRAYVLPVTLTLVVLTAFAQLYHAYSSFVCKSSVVKSAMVIPFYYPLQANRLCLRLGFIPPRGGADLRVSDPKAGTLDYPRQPLQVAEPDSLPNIVLIAIDSWNPRTLTAECMPNVSRFADESSCFTNHFSSSNGTRNSIFGIFFSLPGIYWDTIEADRIQPLLVRELLRRNYDVRAYASATLLNPPFDRVIFGDVPDLRVSTPGEDSCQRDSTITADFLTDLPDLAAQQRPFFSFLFYDLPHSIALPPQKNTRFQPAWDYADYPALHNKIDPEPFFNLYRNCCFEDDRLIGEVFASLRSRGLLDNTIVIITGDHSQEFNENGKNFWGHNGNYSRWQLGVPLICYFPGEQAARYDHRTTHYDIAPTLMNRVLGVRNPVDDYAAGYLLTDTVPRTWHFYGSGMNYAFIVDEDVILEKMTRGTLEITDRNLDPLDDYRFDPEAFDLAMKRLNAFYK